ALDLRPATEPRRALREDRFAYVPLHTLAPSMDRLLGMRRLFGLRSPVNTAVRLLNPADAPCGVDGVFHPAYIDVHLGVAERMGRGRLVVLKGGGGEAERVPLKPAEVAAWDAAHGRQALTLPAVADLVPHPSVDDAPGLLDAVWRGEATPVTPLATIQATIALGLLALRPQRSPAEAMQDAANIWAQRL
ncbi:MAG TPA: hypothetical protein VHO91_21665, partial [Rhodopila sp.]|nr:hypothetical protein [Rhodopila sp.]